MLNEEKEKIAICKHADRVAIFSFELAERILARYHLDSFFDEWARRTEAKSKKKGRC